MVKRNSQVKCPSEETGFVGAFKSLALYTTMPFGRSETSFWFVGFAHNMWDEPVLTGFPTGVKNVHFGNLII